MQRNLDAIPLWSIIWNQYGRMCQMIWSCYANPYMLIHIWCHKVTQAMHKSDLYKYLGDIYKGQHHIESNVIWKIYLFHIKYNIGTVIHSNNHTKKLCLTKLCFEKLYLHDSSWKLKSHPLLRHIKSYDRRYLKKEMVIQLGIQLQSAIIWNKQTGQTKIWFAKLHLHKASWLIRQHYLLQNARFLQILYNICTKYGGLKCFHAGYAVFSYLETKVFELTK